MERHMRVAVRFIGTALAALAVAPPGDGKVPTAQVPTGTMRFAIVRSGDQIGTHTIEIGRAGPEINVRSTTDLTVKIFGITAYRLEHSATERWVKGLLVGFNS